MIAPRFLSRPALSLSLSTLFSRRLFFLLRCVVARRPPPATRGLFRSGSATATGASGWRSGSHATSRSRTSSTDRSRSTTSRRAASPSRPKTKRRTATPRRRRSRRSRPATLASRARRSARRWSRAASGGRTSNGGASCAITPCRRRAHATRLRRPPRPRTISATSV